MSNELIINASLPETRIALMENNEIQDLVIERASGKGIVGNIYKGRVTRVLPGMQAAFVDIGLEKAAFLYVDDVYTSPEIWAEDTVEDDEEEAAEGAPVAPKPSVGPKGTVIIAAVGAAAAASATAGAAVAGTDPILTPKGHGAEGEDAPEDGDEEDDDGEDEALEGIESVYGGEGDDAEEDDEDSEDSEEDDEPELMGPAPGDGEGSGEGDAAGRDAIPAPSEAGGESPAAGGAGGDASAGEEGGRGARGRRHRRGRRGGRFRNREGQAGGEGEGEGEAPRAAQAAEGGTNKDASAETYPENLHAELSEENEPASDRSEMADAVGSRGEITNRPEAPAAGGAGPTPRPVRPAGAARPEFKEPRNRDRRIKAKESARPPRGQVNIQDLLKEGQEVIVQVAKDPISTKGARLTCHISLPGRHLVCMPTIDHVGVSRRIERDDERRKLRDFVEKNRPKNLGFIVRTASGRGQSERRIKQDIDYLVRLWNEIKEKANSSAAPALVYEDLNAVLRAIRDWVTEDIDKIVVDSRYHFNEIQRFVSHFMPSLKQKVELYHGDVPIFDAYNISTELSRAMERKVWLKSGGYLVIDQAEALVAIDVNTGRFVGKKNLEDTILKTNLEAVQEIAYQLRLRNCGGIIILDLIDMEKEENKQRVYRALEEALKADRARPTILKISELGLVEMTRKRTRDTIVRSLCESCENCEGKGFVKSKQTVAYEILREIERVGIERDVTKILVQASPEVIDILAIEERETLDQLERRYRKQVYLQAIPDQHTEQFEVSGDKGPRSTQGRREEGSRAQPGRSSGSGERGDRNGRERGGRDRNRQDRDRAAGSANGQSGGRSGGREIILTPNPTRATITIPTPRVDLAQAGAVAADGAAAHAVDAGFAPVNGAAPRGEHDNDEDRLAFLRAQAAQDAALAGLRNNGGGAVPGNAGAAPRSASGRAPAAPGAAGGTGTRGRRGKRGGRFRRGSGAGAPVGSAPRGERGAAAGGGEAHDGGGSGGVSDGGGGGEAGPQRDPA